MNDEPNAPKNRETRKAKLRGGGRRRRRAEAVRTPQVFAGACPQQREVTKATRVYRTLGEVRYCVCDDCGHTWKQPAAS
jgi:hypothetical protein